MITQHNVYNSETPLASNSTDSVKSLVKLNDS